MTAREIIAVLEPIAETIRKGDDALADGDDHVARAFFSEVDGRVQALIDALDVAADPDAPVAL